MIKKTTFILCFIFVGTFLCFSQFNPDLQRNLRMICGQFDYNLNPHEASFSTEAQLLNGLYEGLFSYDPKTLEALPAIAKDYKISRNRLTWTFFIRENAKFSDGTKITSQHIKDSWLSLLNPNSYAPFASLLDCIDGAEEYRLGKIESDKVAISCPNETTLVVRLASPISYFDKILCHHAFSAFNPEKNLFSGAFTIKEKSKNYIEFEKNPNYWDAENVALPGINIILSDNKNENTYLLNSGKADWITANINTETIIDKNTVHLNTQFSTEYLFFKTNREPLDNPKVRNALLAAVNWELLRADHLIIADSLIFPLPYYPMIPGIGDTDIDYAKKLLAEAGIPENTLEITFAIADDEYYFKLAKILEDSWSKIGVKLNIEKTPSYRYLNSISGWNADLFAYSWIGDFADPMAFLELFRGGSTLNETKWHNDNYDNLIEEGNKILDQEKRYEKLAEAEQLLLDNGVILPISHTVSFNVVDYTVLSGWTDNALDIHPFKYLFFKESEQNLTIVKNDNL